MTTPYEPVRVDFIDYPTGWRIQREGLTGHDDRCSALHGPFLCDCAALPLEWGRRVEAQTGAYPTEAVRQYLPSENLPSGGAS